MADERARIVLEVDEKGTIASISSANRTVAGLEAQFVRSGQTLEGRLLAKIATLKNQMAADPMRLKELDSLQEKVMGRMAANSPGSGRKYETSCRTRSIPPGAMTTRTMTG